MLPPGVCSLCSGVSEVMSVKPDGVVSMPCMTLSASAPSTPMSPNVEIVSSPPKTRA